MFFILSFTLCLLLMLIAPSWVLFCILLGGISLSSIFYLYIFEKNTTFSIVCIRVGHIFLGGLVCLSVFYYHSHQYSKSLESSIETRREGEAGGSVLLSGTVADFRRNDTVVLLVGEDRYLLREVTNSEIYHIGSRLLVSGYESKPDEHMYTNLWKRFFEGSAFPQALPSLFIDGFDYDAWRHMKGYVSDIYVSGVVHQGETSISYLDKKKNKLRHIVAQFSEKKEINALLLGMLIGDVSWMSQEQYDRYIQSGLVHIVAVSGGNMLLLIVLLRFLFFWLPYYPRLLVIVFFMGVYALLCGLDSSVFRALIMGVLTLGALFLGRSVSIWRAMACAWCIILLYSPMSLLYDLGFLLSFAALGSIVVFTRFFPLELEAPRYVRYAYEYVGITIAANVGVFPILILFIGHMNLVGFLGNILVLPLVAGIMLLGVIYICGYIYHIPFLFDSVTCALLSFIEQVAMYSQYMHITISVDTISSKISLLLIYVVCLLAVYNMYYKKQNT